MLNGGIRHQQVLQPGVLDLIFQKAQRQQAFDAVVEQAPVFNDQRMLNQLLHEALGFGQHKMRMELKHGNLRRLIADRCKQAGGILIDAEDGDIFAAEIEILHCCRLH